MLSCCLWRPFQISLLWGSTSVGSAVWFGPELVCVCVCVCVCVTQRERNSWHTSRCRQPKPPTAERRVHHHHLYYTSRKHKREKDREAVQRQETREQERADRKYNVKRDKERHGILSQEETMIKWVLTYNGGIFPVGSRPPIICCLRTLLNALIIRPDQWTPHLHCVYTVSYSRSICERANLELQWRDHCIHALNSLVKLIFIVQRCFSIKLF